MHMKLEPFLFENKTLKEQNESWAESSSKELSFQLEDVMDLPEGTIFVTYSGKTTLNKEPAELFKLNFPKIHRIYNFIINLSSLSIQINNVMIIDLNAKIPFKEDPNNPASPNTQFLDALRNDFLIENMPDEAYMEISQIIFSNNYQFITLFMVSTLKECLKTLGYHPFENARIASGMFLTYFGETEEKNRNFEILLNPKGELKISSLINSRSAIDTIPNIKYYFNNAAAAFISGRDKEEEVIKEAAFLLLPHVEATLKKFFF